MTPTPVRYVLLTTAQVAACRDMTYPVYAAYLDAPDDPDTVAVVALPAEGNEPLGLGLARGGAREGRILSLFVVPPARRQHIATGLLERLEEGLARRGVTVASLTYPTGRESTPAVERLLLRRGWDTPVVHFEIFHAGRGSFESAKAAAWYRPSRLSPEYLLFPWKELTPDDRAVIAREMASGIVPPAVSPFQDEGRIDGEVSVGLRYQGTVAGWMICHRLAPHTLRYTSLYVHPDLPHKGLGLRLVVEASLRQEVCEGDADFAITWACAAGNRVIALCQRSLAPFMKDLTTTTTMASRKVLEPRG